MKIAILAVTALVMGSTALAKCWGDETVKKNQLIVGTKCSSFSYSQITLMDGVEKTDMYIDDAVCADLAKTYGKPLINAIQATIHVRKASGYAGDYDQIHAIFDLTPFGASL